MKRKNNVPDAAAEFTHTAAERSADLRDSIVEAITPLLEQAQENLGPIAQDTKKKGAAFAATALDKAQPRLNDALDSVTPAVDSAREHVQDNWIPKLSEVLHTAAELPEIANAAVLAGSGTACELSKKELKKANKKARKLAKKDAKRFGKSSKKAQDQAVAQLKGALPEPQHKGRNTFVGILAALSIVGGIIWLVKKYLGEDSEAGWTAHEPSKAYTQQRVAESESEGMVTTPPPMADAAVNGQKTGTVKEKTTDAKSDAAKAQDKAADAAKDKAGDAKDKMAQVADAAKAKAADVAEGAAKVADDAKDKAGQLADAAKDKAADAQDGAAKIAGEAKDKAADAADAAKDKASDAAGAAKDKAADAKDKAEEKAAERKEYGEGAFVGENPPEGFVVKGNERSMKYHTQGTSGYDRTIADVWFKDEETAEAAGFTKAQR